ncbi:MULTISPECIES: hypothetical protein [Nostoc]|uniref:Phytanoyl-CoA dioxygenase n=2 Tax=Nostoc TaxID=1177 RepID=A0ABR8IKD3_9NOSO|nr:MULTISPECIES: hypothetical protein [Nostoc]MBD2564711.1 hypothetical protein [Nostoc linckia FACHB-391]MBD2651302.1 hypothetical protein [Nostoc foliaceum FACHB-393]
MLKQLARRFPLLYDILYENYKGLTKNPKWLLMRKVARFRLGRAVREFLFELINPSNEYSINESSTIFPDVDVDEVVNSLKTDGFYLGINLPEEILQEIVIFAHSHPCYGNRKTNLGFYYHQKELAESYYSQELKLAGYFNAASLCPAIKQLQNDPKLLAIAFKYLKHKPVHQSTLLWWSFSGETTEQQKKRTFQMFHYDLDDYRFFKFFFYLTDVDVYSGPHVCVQGSHKKKKISYLLVAKSETDEEIINYYGEKSLVTIYGKAGFGFAENTFCFHKGITPINRDRLMLQLEFGTVDYGMQDDIREPSLLQVMNE